MSTHEFDAYLDMQDIIEPDYHEQIALMHEFELTHEVKLKQQGALEALVKLRDELTDYPALYSTYRAKDGRDTIGRTSAGLAVALRAVDRLLNDTEVKGGVL